MSGGQGQLHFDCFELLIALQFCSCFKYKISIFARADIILGYEQGKEHRKKYSFTSQLMEKNRWAFRHKSIDMKFSRSEDHWSLNTYTYTSIYTHTHIHIKTSYLALKSERLSQACAASKNYSFFGRGKKSTAEKKIGCGKTSAAEDKVCYYLL